MADVLYVRNARPNRLIVKYNGLKYLLERRGSREDTASLPADASTDPIVARFLRTGFLEEVSKEAFMTLSARDEDTNYELAVRRASDVAVPMGHESSATPTIIADKDLAATAYLRSPELQFAKKQSTNVELGFEKPELSEEDKTENDKLREELEETKALVQALLAQQQGENTTAEAVEAQPKKVARPRKKTTTTTKSTRAKRSPKS